MSELDKLNKRNNIFVKLAELFPNQVIEEQEFNDETNPSAPLPDFGTDAYDFYINRLSDRIKYLQNRIIPEDEMDTYIENAWKNKDISKIPSGYFPRYTSHWYNPFSLSYNDLIEKLNDPKTTVSEKSEMLNAINSARDRAKSMLHNANNTYQTELDELNIKDQNINFAKSLIGKPITLSNGEKHIITEYDIPGIVNNFAAYRKSYPEINGYYEGYINPNKSSQINTTADNKVVNAPLINEATVPSLSNTDSSVAVDGSKENPVTGNFNANNSIPGKAIISPISNTPPVTPTSINNTGRTTATMFTPQGQQVSLTPQQIEGFGLNDPDYNVNLRYDIRNNVNKDIANQYNIPYTNGYALDLERNPQLANRINKETNKRYNDTLAARNKAMLDTANSNAIEQQRAQQTNKTPSMYSQMDKNIRLNPNNKNIIQNNKRVSGYASLPNGGGLVTYNDGTNARLNKDQYTQFKNDFNNTKNDLQTLAKKQYKIPGQPLNLSDNKISFPK